MMINKLTVKATVENLRRVTDFVDSCLEASDCSVKAQMQIDVAVEEVFVNVAQYAYTRDESKGSGDVIVQVNRFDDPPSVEVTFTDSGIPFDPLSKKDPDITLPVSERQIGGLGIFMVKKIMDDVSYEYKDGQNVLTMRKYL